MTNTEKRLYLFIQRHKEKHKRTPTYSEMITEMGWKSQATVAVYLKRLEQHGKIERGIMVKE